MASSAAISWIFLRPLIASMATLAWNSGLWVRRLLIGGSPGQGRYPASEANDGACPEKLVHLNEIVPFVADQSYLNSLSIDQLTQVLYGHLLSLTQAKPESDLSPFLLEVGFFFIGSEE